MNASHAAPPHRRALRSSVVRLYALFAGVWLFACDGGATTSPNADPGSGGGQNTAARMFEARTAAERGDEAKAVELFSQLCEEAHADACEELMTRAETDADLKRKLCFELNYSKAC